MKKNEYLPEDADLTREAGRNDDRPDSRRGTRGKTANRAAPDKSVAYARNVPTAPAEAARRRKTR